MNAPWEPGEQQPTYAPRPIPAAMLDALKARFGDRCSTAMALREQHGRDESPFDVPPSTPVMPGHSTLTTRASNGRLGLWRRISTRVITALGMSGSLVSASHLTARRLCYTRP